jgi:selenocysteine lyase/cysteine desulfurase
MKPLEAYREEFPVLGNCLYFNHASTGPLPRRSAEAMASMARDQMNQGGLGYEGWLQAYQGARSAAARLIHADPLEIALTKNTSEGLSFVANGLDWRPGDVAVGVQGEFPANYLPWARLARRGVKLRWLELRQGLLDLEEIDRALDGARLFAVSYVQYISGFRLDLEAVGEICRRRGCLFVVDAVQGLGPFPVDVGRSGIAALSASCHKWLLGPEGAAMLYVRRDLAERLEPVEFGWTNVEGYPRHSYEETLREGAGRFECGTLNTVGCFGMRASLELFLEAGVKRMSDAVHALVERLIEGASEQGYRVYAQRHRPSGSGIVSIRKDGTDSAEIARELTRQRVSVSERKGWLRISPHFYNSASQVEDLLGRLP